MKKFLYDHKFFKRTYNEKYLKKKKKELNSFFKMKSLSLV